MATEPFTIRLLIGVIPDLKLILAKRSSLINLSMFDILEAFVNRWIENEISRLDKEDCRQLSEFIDVDENDLFTQDSMEYMISCINQEALKLISYLWVNDKASSNKFSSGDTKAITDSDQSMLPLIIKCLPVQPAKEQDTLHYSFIHKSVLDYYLARNWLQDFSHEKEGESMIRNISELRLNQKYIGESEAPSLVLLGSHLLEQEQSTKEGV